MIPKIEWYSVDEGFIQLMTTQQASKLSREKNIIKFDGYRENNRWTVLGPEGRVGDYATFDEAKKHV